MKASSELESVIDPVTLKLCLGVENTGRKRKCMFGVMEEISFTVSHPQIISMVSLFSSWGKTIESLTDSGEDAIVGVEIIEEGDEDAEEEDLDFSPPPSPNRLQKVPSHTSTRSTERDPIDLAHFSVALQKFKVRVVNANDDSVEAHLISATASLTQCSDGSSFLDLQMGHFWILDYLKGASPRKQRLLAHSQLPLSASSYAMENNYDIEASFKDNDEAEINSLADIKISKSTQYKWNGRRNDPFSLQDCDIASIVIDAKFSTLFIHW